MKGLPNYAKDVRPWGQFERFTLNEKSTVKIITVKPNEELSLQAHEHRDEEWHILAGSGAVVIGDKKIAVKPGEDFFVSRGVKHRVAGGPHGLVFLEIALGEFDEKDITRFQDRYGRT
ncbi:MAG TPA: phosphomannose isomerase type II C-terminal cupin domain [Candidatus Paceibacterota bacterium]|nr:phosphomannose isomerase type II C-terminal cupin domain [Candidatus Paceibacterota bacterium]